MGCGTTTVKISSIIFNIIFGLLAIACIIWIALNQNAFTEGIVFGAYTASALIIIFALLGCAAAIKESICLSGTCAVFLLILAILQIVFTCIGMSDHKASNAIEIVNKDWEDSDEMDSLQLTHHCCGKDSAQDYVLLGKPIPASCYSSSNTQDPSNLYMIGCTAKLRDFLDNQITNFAIVSWLLIAFELIGFCLAVFLAINFRNKQRRHEFEN